MSEKSIAGDTESAVTEALALLAAAREESQQGPEALRELIDDGRRW